VNNLSNPISSFVLEPWPTPLIEGFFLQRYKRFFVDFEKDNSSQYTALELLDHPTYTAHTTNTGSLKGVLSPRAPILVLPTPDPKRKLQYSLKAVQSTSGQWVGVDTSIPNKMLLRILQTKPEWVTPDFQQIKKIQRECKISEESRLDALVTMKDDSKLYIEVKNVTLGESDPQSGKLLARFPDSITTRGTKHLLDLQNLVKQGHQAHLIFMVQRTDCVAFDTAYDIDPVYAQHFKQALHHGVNITVYELEVTPSGVYFRNKKLPLHHSCLK
jgi:sugar fermentation stimulation protein A